MKLTVFLLLRAAPSWLRLGRDERRAIAGQSLGKALARPGLTLRHFDAEAFQARISDVAMITAEDPAEYYFAIEALRDSPLIADGHFELVEVIPAYEDGFEAYEAREGRGDAA